MEATPRFTYYHAGPLFTLAELHTNTLLAGKIRTLSNGKFIPMVPQDLEQRDTSPHSIRDQDIRSLLSCDLALFTYDGAELDSGTVVEYMMAKFADMPCVILRTDFRKAGDQQSGDGGTKGDPWNLMSSFWPRTEKVVVDSMMGYKNALARALDQHNVSKPENVTSFDVGGGPVALAAGEMLLDEVAREVVKAMENAINTPPTMPVEVREHVYEWLALMPLFKSMKGSAAEVKGMMDLLKSKQEKGML